MTRRDEDKQHDAAADEEGMTPSFAGAAPPQTQRRIDHVHNLSERRQLTEPHPGICHPFASDCHLFTEETHLRDLLHLSEMETFSRREVRDHREETQAHRCQKEPGATGSE
jgi:hypothetical protein